MLKKLYLNLSMPEKDAKKTGILRTLCAIFGGLFVAYLGMTLLTYIIPGTLADGVIVSLIFNTFTYAIVAFWIIISPTKLEALLRSIVPTLIFIIAIFFLSGTQS